LKFGEFADHLGDEVGLGEAGGLFGEVCQILPVVAQRRWGGGSRASG
jgi:hypothetical protein